MKFAGSVYQMFARKCETFQNDIPTNTNSVI